MTNNYAIIPTSDKKIPFQIRLYSKSLFYGKRRIFSIEPTDLQMETA